MARSSTSRRVAGQELFQLAPAVGADREQVGASNADQLMHVACHRLGFDMKQVRAGARAATKSRGRSRPAGTPLWEPHSGLGVGYFGFRRAFGRQPG